MLDLHLSVGLCHFYTGIIPFAHWKEIHKLLITDTNSLIISNTQIIGLLILIIQHKKKISASSGTKLVVSYWLNEYLHSLYTLVQVFAKVGWLIIPSSGVARGHELLQVDWQLWSFCPTSQAEGGRKTVLINGKLLLSLSSSVFVTSLQAQLLCILFSM